MRLPHSPLALLALMALLLAACAAPTTPTGGSASAPRSGAASRQQPAASPDYFAGKTITLQVNYSPGGPTDVSARMIAQYLGKHVPGNPQIIVENKAGAGGLVGKNYVYNVAKKDGTLIGVFSAGLALWRSAGEKRRLKRDLQYAEAELRARPPAT